MKKRTKGKEKKAREQVGVVRRDNRGSWKKMSESEE